MKLFEFLGKALSEDTGNPSSMRIGVLYTMLLFTTVLTFAMFYVCLTHPDLIISLATIISALLTSLFGWKAYQKGKEVSAGNVKSETGDDEVKS
ncbi:MAG: hypothetical protein WC879_03335 [Melioribacteraceae bacterium]